MIKIVHARQLGAAATTAYRNACSAIDFGLTAENVQRRAYVFCQLATVAPSAAATQPSAQNKPVACKNKSPTVRQRGRNIFRQAALNEAIGERAANGTKAPQITKRKYICHRVGNTRARDGSPEGGDACGSVHDGPVPKGSALNPAHSPPPQVYSPCPWIRERALVTTSSIASRACGA